MKIYFNKINKSFSIYDSDIEYIPTEDEIIVGQDVYEELQEKLMNYYIPTYNVINNSLYISYELNVNLVNAQLRSRRETLLEAFDKWEKAVLRNREVDDPYIMSWYQNLKDLVQSAFDNVPERIKYYLT